MHCDGNKQTVDFALCSHACTIACLSTNVQTPRYMTMHLWPLLVSLPVSKSRPSSGQTFPPVRPFLVPKVACDPEASCCILFVCLVVRGRQEVFDEPELGNLGMRVGSSASIISRQHADVVFKFNLSSARFRIRSVQSKRTLTVLHISYPCLSQYQAFIGSESSSTPTLPSSERHVWFMFRSGLLGLFLRPPSAARQA